MDWSQSCVGSFFKPVRQSHKLEGKSGKDKGNWNQPLAQPTGFSQERWKSGNTVGGGVSSVGLQLDCEQADVDQSCRAVACRDLCNNHCHHVVPDHFAIPASSVVAHSGAKMCQEFWVVAEPGRPKEDVVISSGWDVESTCPDL